MDGERLNVGKPGWLRAVERAHDLGRVMETLACTSSLWNAVLLPSRKAGGWAPVTSGEAEQGEQAAALVLVPTASPGLG